MAEKGAKQVSLVGIEDKREITAVLAVNMAGEMLPAQVIYGGSTERCHPTFEFPKDWHITHTPNHWSTEGSMLTYVEKIIKPYVEKVRERMGSGQPALCIFDTFAAHKTQSVQKKLEEIKVKYVVIPPGCTGELQPLDLTVNDYFKRKLKGHFNDWYSDEVERELRGGLNPTTSKANFQLSVIKPLHAGWMVSAFAQTKERVNLIRSGFSKAGLLQTLVDTDISGADTEESSSDEDILEMDTSSPVPPPCSLTLPPCRYPL